MIKIFGSTGFMGSAIAAECDRRGMKWVAGIRQPDILVSELMPCELAINCAAFIPTPSVDACKLNKDETILGNVIWPMRLSEICEKMGTPLMHLSTACLFDEQREYSETDTPTRGWDGHCGDYVGGKLLAEKIVSQNPMAYILRLRLPFDERSHPKNYLNKLASFDRVFTHTNSLTHRGDFAKWALDLWEKRAPFGTYHCCNEGQISAKEVASRMFGRGIIKLPPTMAGSPNTTGARLSVKKLTDAGIKVRHVEEAVDEAISKYVH